MQRAVGVACLMAGVVYMGLIPFQVDPSPLGVQAGFRFSGRTFPLLTGCGLIVASAVLLFSTNRSLKRLQREGRVVVAGDGEPDSPRGLTGSEMALALGVTASGLVYVWAMRYAGYWLATSAVVAVTSMALGSRNHLVTIAWSLAFTLAITVVFARILYVPLPKGVLGI